MPRKPEIEPILEPEDEWAGMQAEMNPQNGTTPGLLPAATIIGAETPAKKKRKSPTRPGGNFTADQVGQVLSLIVGDKQQIAVSGERICELWKLLIGGELKLVVDDTHDTVIGYLDISSLKKSLPQLLKLL